MLGFKVSVECFDANTMTTDFVRNSDGDIAEIPSEFSNYGKAYTCSDAARYIYLD